LLAFLARLTHKAAPARALAWGANAGFSVKDALPELSCPTLVLHGGADMLIPPTAGRQIARAIPGASWEVFAGGGHNFPLKQAEGFEAAVVAHLVAAGALPVTD
jgi:pimeloyl-ACP methyl ester carboxylesterase